MRNPPVPRFSARWFLPFAVGATSAVCSAAVVLPAPAVVKEQEVTFPSGSVSLAGTLLRPAGAGPFPAMVLLHGSGPGPREHLRRFAERFAELGMVTLIFDKRGSGASTGSWLDASLDDLALDALAAAAFLKSDPQVDAHRVGVWGISQAGWVIPRAAARAPSAFAFAVVVTGGALKPIDLERHDYAAALEAAGALPDQRRQGLALVDRYFAYLRTGADRVGLEKAIRAASSEPWGTAVPLDRVLPPEAARSKWAWVAGYDPAQDIQQMRMPILVVIGDRDRPALAPVMHDRWRDSLLRADNHDATIFEFLEADHGANVRGTHHMGGAPPRFVAGYLETMDAWLRAHALPSQPEVR